MHILITGATGTVGAAALQYCLASPNITQLSILSRRQFAFPQGYSAEQIQKARIIIHDDYLNYPQILLDSLKGASGCIWAQGVSQNAVEKGEYIRITHDYPIAAAKAFSTLPEDGTFNFVYVSGEGADTTERLPTLFSKIKGRTEKELLELSSSPNYKALKVYNVRPGYVDPPGPHRPRSAIRKLLVDSILAPTYRALLPSQVTPVNILSKVLTDLATADGEAVKEGTGVEAGGRTLRNIAIRNFDEL